MALFKMRIRARLLTSFIIIMMLGLGSSLIGLVNLISVSGSTTELSENVLKPMASLTKITELYLRAGVNIRDAFLVTNESDRNNSIFSVTGLIEEINRMIGEYEPTVHGEDALAA